MINSYYKEIKAARPANIARIITSFVQLVVGLKYDINELVLTFFVHITGALFWFFLVESFYSFTVKKPNLWYLTCSLDLLLVSSLIYATGTAFSPAIMGYIIITTLSSTDIDEKKGVFAALGSCLIYFTIALMVYFNIIPYQNIINHGVSTNLNLFSLLLSTFLLFLGCYTVNRVIFTIYSQLQEKNESLQLTLNEITNLKYQQDGDYFLTSLLIEPFNVNNTKSNKVKIEIKVNQYKKFKFKTNESEIGGDICTAENLKIGNKNFIVFLNGDAMGKSMQGAGGALVFSSVFKSILSRFEKMDPIDFSPENFIETSFYELQSIFESFEGLMMVSAILGIIDEDTGELYFLNAEHPFAILFRDNMGTFLEERTVVRKLGTPTFMQKFTNPSKFKMLKGDSIFIGSDGKDDIALLSKNERIIDSDEKRFIRVLERAGGDMDKIVEELKKEGEFADDLTLIKIHYSG